jgi:hypothetical protein
MFLPGPPLTAHCVDVPGKPLTGAIAVSGRAASPYSLMLAADGGQGTLIEQIAMTGSTTPMLTIRDSLPDAFDRSGSNLLYLVGHRPPVLWEATIANGRLTGQRRLNTKAAPIAW